MADPFSIAGSGVSVISLGLTVLSGLLQYYGDWKGSEKDIAATYTSIEGLTKTFMLIKDTIDGQAFRRDIVERVTESLDSCSAGVQRLERKLAKIRKATPDKPGEKFRAHARKAAYPFKKSTLVKLAEVVSDLRDNLSLAVDTLQLDVSASSSRKLENISARLATLVQQSQSASADIVRRIAEVRLTQKEHDSRSLDQESLQVISWLSPLNFSIRQNDVLSRRQQGSGNWLLHSDRFQMWLDRRINTLWCPGMPGAGKTVLASVIVDYLKQSTREGGVGIGYVYCIYNAVDQTATNLMASLFQQLVRQQSGLSEDVTSLYSQHSRDGTRPSLLEYTKLLQAHIQRFSRVFIVVDALDECSENDDVRHLFLDQLRYLSPNISLLVTSRHIPSLDRALEDATTLEIRANDEDLRTYLQARIEDQALMSSHCKEDPSLKDAVISNIIDKANGMFLLAELHLNSLVTQDNRRALRRALQSLPEDIDQTYDKTMLRIDSQGSQKAERAGQVLSWISHAERPLTIRELQCGLAIEPGDTEFDEEAVPNETALLSVCCGLVVVEQESNIVRFVHFTTERYIEKIRTTRYPSAQRLLSEACLTYLSLKVFASGPCLAEDREKLWEILEPRLQFNRLLGYAAQHWGDHARKAIEQGLNIEDMILEFLRARGNVGRSIQVAHPLMNPFGYWGLFEFTNISGLHIAAGFGLEKLARKLIDQGTDVNVRDYEGCTPLHRAAAKGHDATVRMLLDHGANIRAEDQNLSTAVQYAASAGYERVVQTLVEVELKVPTSFLRGMSPAHVFHAAAGSGQVKVIQVLLKYLEYVERSEIIVSELLRSAAGSGQERVVSLLLEGGEGLEGFDSSKGPALREAAAHNFTSVMSLLLKAGADVNTDDSIEGTALHIAADHGHVAATQLLLDKGAELETIDAFGDKPLHIAARYGHDKVISLLLDKGVNMDAFDQCGETALISAAKKGSVHVVRQLLDRGANMTVNDRCSGRSALHWAIVEGHETVVHLFLEQEISEGLTDNCIALTRLYCAIEAEDDNGIQKLLSNKEMLQSKDIREYLSLHAAAKHGYESVVEVFLEYGAEVDAKAERSRTALMLAVWGEHTPVVKLLLESGANLEAKDENGHTALIWAVDGGRAAVVKLLLKHGADINSNNGGQTALSYAIEQRKTPLVELLLEQGADIECTGIDTTALVQAACGGDVELVRLLLQAGANVNARARPLRALDDNETSLHQAARWDENEKIVKMLIERGADLEAQNSKGETALVTAVRKGRVVNTQLLLERGADPNTVEATVTLADEFTHEVYIQRALQLVEEAQKTWKGKETGTDEAARSLV